MRIIILILFSIISITSFGQTPHTDAYLKNRLDSLIRGKTFQSTPSANQTQLLIDGKVSILNPKLKTTSTTGYVWTATDNIGNGSWQATVPGFTLTDGNATTADGTGVDWGGDMTNSVSVISDNLSSRELYMSLGSSSDGGATEFYMNSDPASHTYFFNMSSFRGGQGTQLTVGNVDAFFQDTRSGSDKVGLLYSADYSATFINRSLVDKAYVDGLTVATPLAIPYGGTGNTSLTAYAILAGGTTSTGNLQQVSGLGTSGYVLTSNGAGALPTWQAASGGITNGAAANEFPKSNGTNIVSSSTFSTTDGGIELGGAATGNTDRFITTAGSQSSIDINLIAKGSSGGVVIDNTGVQGFLQIGSGTAQSRLSTGDLVFYKSGSQHQNIIASQGIVGNEVGSNLTLQAGSGYASGNTDGGNVYVNPGAKNGSGLDGNIGLLTSSGSFGAGEKVIFIANNTTNSSTTISNGVVVQSIAGTLNTKEGDTDYRLGSIQGSFSQVGAATTVFSVSIGETMPSTSYKVNVSPTATLSAALFYITNKTTTTFDVTYLAGLTGTVTFDWEVTP